MQTVISQYRSLTPDVKVEKFTFEFTDEYSCDTEFVIGLGDRLYRSYFSDWSSVTWDEFRANAITQLKSQVIEDYLNE